MTAGRIRNVRPIPDWRGKLLLLILGVTAAASGAPVPPPGGEPPPPAPNILLITLDTTRADHLPCYGYDRPTAPFICDLASRGVLFRRAFSQTPLTLPAHVTLMTGTGPERHRVVDNGLFRLPSGLPTFAEAARRRGYHTRAYIAAAVLDRVYGLNRGFDIYDDEVRVGRPQAFGYRERAASQVVDAVAADGPGTWPRPFFLWVHFYDPHDPYVPPAPYNRRFSHPYDGEIAFVDDQMRRLFLLLKDAGAWNPQRDWVVIAGDHGEDLGDHGEMRHGLLLTPATLRVPLIILPPAGSDALPRGKAIRRPVGLQEVLPALQGLLGWSRRSAGRDLWDEQASPTAWVLATYMPFFSFRWSPLLGVLDWPYLCVRGNRMELYNLEQDPDAKRNRAEELPRRVRRCRRVLAQRWPEDERLPNARPDPELFQRLEELRSLGYVGSAPSESVKNPFVLPHPSDRIWVYRALLDTKPIMAEGRWREARRRLLRLIKADPGNTLVLSNLATAYEAMGEYDRALECLRRVTLLIPAMDYPWVHLGEFMLRRNRYDDAVRAFTEALRRNPRNAGAYLGRFEAEMRRGRMQAAAEVLDTAEKNRVMDPDLALFRAILERSAGRLTEAEANIEQALRANPEDPRYWVERLRIACDPRQPSEDQCSHLLPRVMVRAAGIPEAWVTAARWYLRRSRLREASYCWSRAMRFPNLRPEHRREGAAVLRDLEASGVRPKPPDWASRPLPGSS